MDKIQIKNFPTGTPASYVGVDATGKEVLVPTSDVLAMEHVASVSGTNKMRYTQYKYGATNGAGDKYLLIAPIPNLTDSVDTIGVLGSLFLLRGGLNNDGSVYAPLYAKLELSFFRTSIRFLGDLKVASIVVSGASSNFTLGTCFHNGQMYMAIKFNTAFAFRTCFQGFYTYDCVFKHVVEPDISDWTDL